MASIKCRYLDGTTKICYNTESFSDIKVNGVSIGLTTDYNVNASDEVEFVLSGTEVKSSAFKEITGLVTIDLSIDITHIGMLVFYGCSNLSNIISRRVYLDINQSAFRNVKKGGTLHYPTNGWYGNWLSPYMFYLGYSGWGGLNDIPADTITEYEPSRIICTYDYPDTETDNIIVLNPDDVLDVKVNGVSLGVVKEHSVLPTDKVEIIKGNGETTHIFGEYVSSVNIYNFKIIREHTFWGEKVLKDVTLCDGLKKIQNNAFDICPSLEKIYIKATTAPEIEKSFRSIKEGGTLYYPTGSDYSTWLSTGPYCLGSYGWNGVEMDPEDMPDYPTDPDTPEDDDNKLDEINMEVYVNNSPIVFGYQGGYKSSSISIGGNAFKDGFEVSEFKNLESSADWLEFSYEEGGSDDGKTYYYYFDFNCSENMKSDQRMAICSGEYVLTDGRMGTFSFVVYQDANGLIDIKGNNPLIFQAYERGVTKETEVYYEGISYVGNTSFNTNIDSISVKRSSASNESSGMLVDYEIIMDEYNVYENDFTGAIEYVLMDPDTSEDLIFEQQAVIRGCQYPFGLKKVIDGEYYDIGTKDDVKTIVVNPSGETIAFETYYPFYMQGGSVTNNAYRKIVLNNKGDSGISMVSDTNILVDGYDALQDKYYVTFNGNETESTRTATLEISYRTKDNVTHTDKVIMIQSINTIDPDVPVDPDTPVDPEEPDNTPSISLEKNKITFDNTGYAENFGVLVTYTNAQEIYAPVCNADWVTITELLPQQGGNTGSTNVKSKRYGIEVTETTTARTATVTFSCKSDTGRVISNSSFVIEQTGKSEEDEENTPVVNAFTQIAKVKIDGTPEMASFTNIACGYAGVEIQEPLIEGNWIHLGTPTTGSGIGYDTVLRYPISFDANDGEPRQGKITFSGLKTDGETLTSICTISQAGTTVDPDEPDTPDIPDVPVDGEDYIGPIWKDVEFDFGTIDIVEYGIFMPVDGYDVLLFAGRSYLRPNGISNKIIVNKICQDYMEAPLLDKDSLAVGGGYQVFKLKSIDGSREYRTYRFVNDWSYDDYFNTGLLSHPILKNDNKVYKNQLLPFTVFGASETVGVTYGIQYGGHKDEYGNVIPDWSNGDSVRNNVVTEIFPYSGRTKGAVSYTINGKKYDIVDDCVKYVLYYVNPWGGYDWFPIRGKVVEKDTMTSYTYTQNFNNQTWEFGKRRYLTSINKHFTLHTEWMSEDESSRMWYLLQSNVVYLHNLKENKVYPVIITNTEQEHKKRLRGTRISYQIEVDLSQNRERI